MKRKNDQLKTERLVLKPYDPSDQPQMVAILCNESIKKTFMIPDFSDQQQAVELFERLMEFSKSSDHFEYGIYWNGTLIGFVNDCGMNQTTIEIGYVIHPDYQGKGFATEAVSACIQELFRMGYKHIHAAFFSGNTASQRIMEKCGMHKLDCEGDLEYQGILQHVFYYGIDKR